MMMNFKIVQLELSPKRNSLYHVFIYNSLHCEFMGKSFVVDFKTLVPQVNSQNMKGNGWEMDGKWMGNGWEMAQIGMSVILI